MNDDLPSFWTWFTFGAGGRAGVRRVVNLWLLLHAAVGTTLSYLVSAPIEVVAEKTLLPVMAIFVGLTFSWAGNAHALLQSDEIIQLSKERKGGIFEYVFTFQLCILVLLVTMCFWVVPSLQLPYLPPYEIGRQIFENLSAPCLYALLSLALRTSWQAVLGANMLLLVRAQMRGRVDAEPKHPPSAGT